MKNQSNDSVLQTSTPQAEKLPRHEEEKKNQGVLRNSAKDVPFIDAGYGI